MGLAWRVRYGIGVTGFGQNPAYACQAIGLCGLGLISLLLRCVARLTRYG